MLRSKPFPIVHEHGHGWITFDEFEEDGQLICGIYMLTGRLDLPPKQWLKVVRETVAELEIRAKAEGFTEMRMSGRDWSRILPDYEPMVGDAPNLIRKRL